MIVGLGNPGVEYAGTRHNAGFDVVNALTKSLGAEVKKKKFGALFGEFVFGGIKLLFVKPQRYMNRSGQVVAAAVGFYKLPLENIIVITDDMSLEAGRMRIRKKGSSGGHNGLEDIINKLGHDEFARLRVGIGQSGQERWEDYVLSRPDVEERELIEKSIEASVKALICWIKEGVEAAMNKFNVRNGV